MKTVIAMTTRYTTSAEIERVRSLLALRTIAAARAMGYEVFVLDGGSFPEFIFGVERLGAMIFPEAPGNTMAAGRRQVLESAMNFVGLNGNVVWMEPEKFGFVPMISEVVKLREEGADIVVPVRTAKSFASYPPEQIHTEAISNLVFQYCTGRKMDVCFGPFAMNVDGLSIFLNYNDEYGGKWEVHQITFMRAIAAGLVVKTIPVDFIYPPAQREAEVGNIEMIKKRFTQTLALIPAIEAEALKLGLKK